MIVLTIALQLVARIKWYSHTEKELDEGGGQNLVTNGPNEKSYLKYFKAHYCLQGKTA